MIGRVKLSVSVPDDLWDRARAVGGDQSPSHLVQSALRRLVADASKAPGYSTEPPADAAEALQAASAKYAAEARNAFEIGRAHV